MVVTLFWLLPTPLLFRKAKETAMKSLQGKTWIHCICTWKTGDRDPTNFIGCPEERKEASRTNGHNHATCSDVHMSHCPSWACSPGMIFPGRASPRWVRASTSHQASQRPYSLQLLLLTKNAAGSAIWAVVNRDKIKTQMEFFYEVSKHKSPGAHITLNISILKRSNSTT